MITVEKVSIGGSPAILVKNGHRTLFEKKYLTDEIVDAMIKGMRVFADKNLVFFDPRTIK